jgi:hypothetical protein
MWITLDPGSVPISAEPLAADDGLGRLVGAPRGVTRGVLVDSFIRRDIDHDEVVRFASPVRALKRLERVPHGRDGEVDRCLMPLIDELSVTVDAYRGSTRETSTTGWRSRARVAYPVSCASTTSATRGSRRTRAFADLGFGRELGEGVNRMYEEMGRAGLPSRCSSKPRRRSG